MFHPERRWWRASLSPLHSWTMIGLLVTLLGANLAAADLTQTYCSSDNTGSDFDAAQLASIYQSNGRCTTNCTDISSTYAFAIVQGQNCWCSDFAPADQVPVSECSATCVGYPFEYCGNQDTGLFGYIQIGTPSGTTGASSPSSTQAPSDSSSNDDTSTAQAQTVVNSVTVTDEHTITASPSVSVFTFTNTPTAASTSHTTPTTSATTSSRSSSTPSSSPASTGSPVASIQILTISNRPVTQTVTSVPTVASADSGSQQPIQQKSGASAGLIAGVVIAAVVAALAVAGLLFFCWRRRKHGQELEASTAATMVGSGTSSTRPTRNTSVLSRTGLLERVYPSAAVLHKANTNSNNGPEMSGASPISERRRSQPLFYDQRLNPTTLMNFDNGSRVSVNTLPDNRDFSRTLNVTNPDPHDSWQ